MASGVAGAAKKKREIFTFVTNKRENLMIGRCKTVKARHFQLKCILHAQHFDVIRATFFLSRAARHITAVM